MAFPEPRFSKSGNTKLAVYEEGTGFPVIFSHGWPELAYSWRHQVPAVAAAGYRAIAPDQRGYGLSDCPPNIEDYDIHQLTGDLCNLMDDIAADTAIIVGHDWGGLVAWAMPKLHADRVAGVIGINTAYIPQLPMDPIELFRQTRGESNYIVQFQNEGVAEKALEEDVERVFRFFMRRPPKDAAANTDGGLTATGDPADGEEQQSFALLEVLKMPDELWDTPDRPIILNNEEMKYYVDVFTRTGFRGGINWYRNFTRNWKLTEGLEDKVDVPCLMISAELDGVLPPSMADGMEQYCPDLEKHVIAGSGHWTQQEKPEEVNALIVEWLNRRFPAS